MKNSKKRLRKLLQVADDFADHANVPQQFIELMGFVGKPRQFCNAAWYLFQHERRPISDEDVERYLAKASKRTKRLIADTSIETKALPVGCVAGHFLDSGSFTLWTKAAQYAKKESADRWAYYDTDEFWAYCDAYIQFVKQHTVGIDLYANIDVIPNPELSWRNLKYLEKRGLKPVPVVHYTTPVKWLTKHIDAGYDLIGLGGLVGSTAQDSCRAWIDKCFDIVCDSPDRMPRVRLHGFGVTNYELMCRYPWYSLDSTSWTKKGAYGLLIVPHKRRGKFVFDEQPYTISVSIESMRNAEAITRYLSMTQAEQGIVRDWLNEIGVPLGKFKPDGEVQEFGVMTRHTERRVANLLFYERMRQELPKYPWAFRSKRMARGKGFDFGL